MQWINTKLKWGVLSQLFHWGIVVLVVTQFFLIKYFEYLPKHDINKIPTILLHKSIGMTILTLVTLRLIWRLFNRVPGLPSDLQRALKIIAKCNHFLLYACLFILPASGYLMTEFSGRSVHVFGHYIPMLVGVNRHFAGLFGLIHRSTAYTLFALICLHFLAAMFHHFVRKDNTLRRMLPLRLK